MVTFNAAQQELIEELLESARRAHPEIEPHFADDHPTFEKVFVKNLENVQGDERDEIFFSIAYGPDENDKMLMNFGPLNREGGERRLNVAVTRARRQLRVFSSITADRIDTNKTRAKGSARLKDLLRFAAEKNASSMARSDEASGDFDSDFERDVYDALRASGYRVETQVGCGGYRIDLAVVHPTEPGVFAIGVECDGAAYHSGATARDRDRLRQEVLEGLGWRLHRIWSTDWIYDRARELDRLLAAVDEAVRAGPRPEEATALGRAEREAATAVREREAAIAAIAALDEEMSLVVTDAKSALASAMATYERCVADEERATAAHTGAQRAHAEARGALTQLRERVNGLDRSGAEERRVAAEKLLRDLPIPTTPASTADLEQATSAHAKAKEGEADASLDLAKTEGAVESIGGHVVAEELQQIMEALEAVKQSKHEVEVDADAWRLLAQTLKDVQAEQGAHLGRSLSKPVTDRLADLTRGRYGVELGPNLEPRRIAGLAGETIEDMLAACSVGTREQLATLVRVTLAEYLKCTIVLDDHLVQTDLARLAWFRVLLRRAANETQLIVLTCRPDDYLAPAEIPDTAATRDLAGGLVRAIDLGRLLGREAAPRKRDETTTPLEAT